MAGFAVNLRLILSYPDANFNQKWKHGMQETLFLSSLNISLNEMEPKAENCSKVKKF